MDWLHAIVQDRPATAEEIELLEMQGLPPEERIVYIRDLTRLGVPLSASDVER